MNAPFVSLRPLVLASSSPRRRAFFQDLGLTFTSLVPQLPEPVPARGETPDNYALRTARTKAEEALSVSGETYPHPVVIAADTIVVLEDENERRILGKPVSATDALAMLKALSGRRHTVITACCLLPAEGRAISFADRADVCFAPWPDAILAAYVATGEPMDKAGAYGIQGIGSFLAERVEGAWTTVVGLPLHRILHGLLELGAIRPNNAIQPEGAYS